MGQETTLTEARKAVLTLKRLHPVSSDSEAFKTIDDYLECNVARKIETEHALMTARDDLAQSNARHSRTVLELAELRARISAAIVRGDIPKDFAL
jgi:hypothetical protein